MDSTPAASAPLYAVASLRPGTALGEILSLHTRPPSGPVVRLVPRRERHAVEGDRIRLLPAHDGRYRADAGGYLVVEVAS